MPIKYAVLPLFLIAIWIDAAIFHYFPKWAWAAWYGFPLSVTVIAVTVAALISVAIAANKHN